MLAQATSLANVTGESVLIGLAGAMQTLCGQAFGAKDYREVGYLWQRSSLILWATCIPITALWLSTEPLLLFTGQERAIAALAAQFLRSATLLPDFWMHYGCMHLRNVKTATVHG